MKMNWKSWLLIGGILILLAFIIFSRYPLRGKATLSWDANAENNVAGYKIYYGPSPRSGDCPSGGYVEKLDVRKTANPEKPSHILKNLKIGRNYYFSVTSYNQAGQESCFSPEIEKRITSVSF